MKVSINFSTSGAAFEDNPDEVLDVLYNVSKCVNKAVNRNIERAGHVLDSNGCTIGAWEATENV